MKILKDQFLNNITPEVKNVMYKYIAFELVKKRVAKQTNLHALYLQFLDGWTETYGRIGLLRRYGNLQSY